MSTGDLIFTLFMMAIVIGGGIFCAIGVGWVIISLAQQARNRPRVSNSVPDDGSSSSSDYGSESGNWRQNETRGERLARWKEEDEALARFIEEHGRKPRWYETP